MQRICMLKTIKSWKKKVNRENYHVKNISCLRWEHTRKSPWSRVSKEFLDINNKAQFKKEKKLVNWNLSKLKLFCSVKVYIIRMKCKTDLRKILATLICVKGHVSLIYKLFNKLNIKNDIKWSRDLNRRLKKV